MNIFINKPNKLNKKKLRVKTDLFNQYIVRFKKKL